MEEQSQSSDQNSQISTMAKHDHQKVPKRHHFFCLKPEIIVEIEDIESNGLGDSDSYDIDKMNESF